MNVTSVKIFNTYTNRPCSCAGTVSAKNVSFGAKEQNYKNHKHHSINMPPRHIASYKNTDAQKEFNYSRGNLNPYLISRRIMEDDISKQELIYVINKFRDNSGKLSKIFITDTGCDPLLKQSDSIMQKICYLLDREEQFRAIALNKDHKGRNFFDKASTEQVRIFNNAVKKFPNILAEIYTTQDGIGRLPAHKITARALESMNFVLAEQPKILRQIYYTKDKNGNTPAHNRLKYGQKVIEKALEDYPEALSRIRSIKNNYNESYDYLLNKIQNYKGPYENTWKYLLNNY